MCSTEAMTKIAAVPAHNKTSHQHHHDEETTAYSSWQDEEDGNSQLSSCLSSVDLNDEPVTCISEEVAELHRGSDIIFLSSSECSLLDSDGYYDDCHSNENSKAGTPLLSTRITKPVNLDEEAMSNRMNAFQELSERASHLLQRERSPYYAVEDYFQRSYYDKTAIACSCTSDTCACKSAADESISDIEYLTPLSAEKIEARRNSAPIDTACRAIMMEWTYRVIDFSFPPPAPQHQEQEQSPDNSKSSTRQHSTESLQLIFTTFSYIDRLCTKFKVVDREEYKLLTMVCLNLAAKSSGLYGVDNEHERCMFFNQQCNGSCCGEQDSEQCREQCSAGTDAASPSCSSCDDIDSSSFKDTAYTSQTILSTPDDDELRIPQRPRPSMDLVSLPGLHSLCNGLFSLDEFYTMEYTILHRGLGWRMNNVHAMDWVDLCSELLVLLQLDGDICLTKSECDEIRERMLLQLEYAIQVSSFVGYTPSLLATAAFLNAVEGYSGGGNCDSILNCIEEVFGFFSLDKSEIEKVRCMLSFEEETRK